ncbi:MAG: DUF5009 domain-containing protein [Chitinophagaceae bacterium]
MNQRFYSLDVFRGATVALMILVNNPGSWSYIYPPLEHAPWHGCTPTDLVFPFFLFAVGNALAFVLPRLEQAGTAAVLQKVLKRTLLIFAIGLFLNWAPFIRWDGEVLKGKPWEYTNASGTIIGIRILGVLQRIALSYCFAALIVYFFKVRGAIAMSILLLLGYWLLTWALGTGDPYSLAGYFGTNVDKIVLGESHMYHGEGMAFDPEGITSTLTSIVQVICGYFAGRYILQSSKAAPSGSAPSYSMLAHLLIAGTLLVAVAFCWDIAFPINKKIWTSSYVLYTTGLALQVLSVLIYLVEFKKVPAQQWLPLTRSTWFIAAAGAVALSFIFHLACHSPYVPALLASLAITAVVLVFATNNWGRFFDVFGKNPLFIFVLSGFLPRVLALLRWVDHVDDKGKKVYTSTLPWFYEHLCKPVSDNLKNGSLLYAVCTIFFYWSIVYLLDKKKIYIKV